MPTLVASTSMKSWLTSYGGTSIVVTGCTAWSEKQNISDIHDL